MRCLNFAAAAAVSLPIAGEAQRVPGRDLLQFPIGTLAEPQALALDTGDGFQNPAAIRLPDGARFRASASALDTGSDQGVGVQLVAVSVALPQRIAVALSAARASIEGIAPTTADPTPTGPDIPYNTVVISISAARRTLQQVTSGIAVRYRAGELDGTRRSTVGLDGGVLAEHLLNRDIRLGVSSLLWSPGSGGSTEATLSTALDARVLGDTSRAARLGYAYTHSAALPREHYLFASGHVSRWIGRAGVARTSAYGDAAVRVRLAIGLRYARYTVGLSREDSPHALAPTYQFTLNGLFR